MLPPLRALEFPQRVLQAAQLRWLARALRPKPVAVAGRLAPRVSVARRQLGKLPVARGLAPPRVAALQVALAGKLRQPGSGEPAPRVAMAQAVPLRAVLPQALTAVG